MNQDGNHCKFFIRNPLLHSLPPVSRSLRKRASAAKKRTERKDNGLVEREVREGVRGGYACSQWSGESGARRTDRQSVPGPNMCHLEATSRSHGHRYSSIA